MNTLKQKIIMACLLSMPIITNAQWGTIGTIGRTVPPFVGIGIGQFPTVPSLNARLHVNNFLLGAPAGPLNGFLFRTDGSNAVVNQWQLFTGATNLTTTQKFSLFVPQGAFENSVFFQATQIGTVLQPTNMIFQVGSNTERMRLVGTTNPNLYVPNLITTYPVRAGNVGIGGTTDPCVMFQMGGNVTNTGGYRNWMDVGTLYQKGSDNMYTGYNNLTGDATINWGNSPTVDGTDRLVFNFTALTGGGFQASGIPGLEASRWVTNGNRFFIGFGGDPNNPNQNPYSNNPDPGNTLEINSVANVIGPLNSGLRFTDMNSTLTPVPNPGLGVLTVDSMGDVIYVPGGAIGFGGLCGTNPPAMTNNYEIPLGGFNYIFSGQTNGTDRLGIGITGSAPGAKLDVFENNSTPNIGIRSIISSGGYQSVAGWFETVGALQGTAIFVPNGGGKVSIGYNTFNNTPGILEVQGTIYMNGNLVSTSDQSYKTNVTNIDNALDKVMSLNGVYFHWDTINYPNNNFSSRKQIGFIAQNLDTIIPEVVFTDYQGKKNVSYERIIALYAQALKELNNKVDSLSQNNVRLNNSTSNNIDVDLTSDIVLYQNTPNPFGESTIIKYYLPSNITTAVMNFMDETGRKIKEVQLTQTGDGQITINAQDLASGIYTYSLYVNGQNVQTRRMLKQK